MAHEHAARVVARERSRELLHWGEGGREITIDVGRAHHFLIFLLGHFVVPCNRLVVVALLQGEACLERKPTGEHRFSFKVQSEDFSTIGIVALLHRIALCIGAIELAEGKNVVEVGVKTFNQEVGLHRAKLAIEVGRDAETVGAFFLQIVGQDGDKSFAAHNAHVQVFIERLWRTESAGIGDAQVHFLRGIETQVGTRAEDDAIHKVMLVETAAEEEAPLLVFPFILEEEAADVDVLLEMTVVTENDVFQAIVVILRTKGEVGRHEEQMIEIVDILRSRNISEVAGGAISLFGRFAVFLRSLADAAVIALAGCCLEGEISGEAVFLVGGKIIEGETTALDVVLHLLGDVRQMGRQIEHVAATAKLMDAMILQTEFGVWRHAEIRTETERLVL